MLKFESIWYDGAPRQNSCLACLVWVLLMLAVLVGMDAVSRIGTTADREGLPLQRWSKNEWRGGGGKMAVVQCSSCGWHTQKTSNEANDVLAERNGLILKA